MSNDYADFRGKCREMSEAAIVADQTLRLARGHYICPVWGKQQHWWTVRVDGSIYDPTAAQFPSKGYGVYVEFDGIVSCAECGKDVPEAEIERAEGRYAWCSYTCYGRFVGVLSSEMSVEFTR